MAGDNGENERYGPAGQRGGRHDPAGSERWSHEWRHSSELAQRTWDRVDEIETRTENEIRRVHDNAATTLRWALGLLIPVLVALTIASGSLLQRIEQINERQQGVLQHNAREDQALEDLGKRDDRVRDQVEELRTRVQSLEYWLKQVPLKPPT